MTRGAIVSFLVLAATVGAVASLKDSQKIALGEQLLEFSNALNQGSHYRHLPKVQAAAVGGALAYGENYDDGYYTGTTGWTGAPIDTANGETINADMLNYIYRNPAYVMEPSPAYSSPAYIPDYTNQNAQSPDMYGQPNYGLSTNNVTNDLNNYYYNNGTAFYQNPVSAPTPTYAPAYYNNINAQSPDMYGQQNVGLSTNNVNDDWLSAYRTTPQATITTTQLPPPGQNYYYAPNANSQVTDSGSWGSGYADPWTRYGTIYNNLYSANNAAYGSSAYNDYATGYVPQTWYTQAFPGIGQSVIPLLPPIYRPTTYSAYDYGYGSSYGYGNAGGYGSAGSSGVSGTLSLIGRGLGISLGLGLNNANYNTASNAYMHAPTYTQPAVAPTCSISVEPAEIPYGGSAIASWVSYNATSASLNGLGAVPISGTQRLSGQTTSRTIGLTVSGNGGTTACYDLLIVAPKPGLAPTCHIAANPDHIRRGESANLTWTSDNASSASIVNLGSVALEGGHSVAPTATTNFVMNVRSSDGRTASCTTTIVVQ